MTYRLVITPLRRTFIAQVHPKKYRVLAEPVQVDTGGEHPESVTVDGIIGEDKPLIYFLAHIVQIC